MSETLPVCGPPKYFENEVIIMWVEVNFFKDSEKINGREVGLQMASEEFD